MIAQLPKLPYTIQRGGEVCQMGTGPLFASHTTVFDSRQGNCKIKGLGKWNAATRLRESKQSLSGEACGRETTKECSQKEYKNKMKSWPGQKTTLLLLSNPKCISWHLTVAILDIYWRDTGSSFHLENLSNLCKGWSFVDVLWYQYQNTSMRSKIWSVQKTWKVSQISHHHCRTSALHKYVFLTPGQLFSKFYVI